ncbi:MAG: type 2 lanthipeptide synthetase LanM family protein [Polyangiaceae bacterium]
MMNAPYLPVPRTFFRAFSLAERVALGEGEPSGDEESRALGSVRSEQHRKMAGLQGDADRQARWAALGITEQAASRLFSESLGSLCARMKSLPPWAQWMQEVYGSREPLSFATGTLSGAATPLVARVERELLARIQAISAAHPEAPWVGRTESGVLTAGLAGELGRMMQKTLVLEMHVARLLGKLVGDDPQSRFQSYLRGLSEPGALWGLFEEYPVLCRLMGERAIQTVEVQSEMMRRLAAGWPRLRAAFDLPADPGPLVAAGVSGDRHDGGRAVAMLRWESGCELVYKPKPLDIDVHFQEMVAWVNERGAEPALPILPVLSCGDHGFTGVVRPASCETAAEVERFFLRQGQMLGLFYGLLATDFHCENVIASGELPYPIDLESLFHGEIGALDTTQSDGALESEIVYSVLRVGLLPERANEGAGVLGVDLSGLGGEEGQLSAMPQPFWENAGTDAMALGRKPLPVIGSENLPRLGGETVKAFLHTDQLVQGLNRMYRLLVEHRGELVGPGGALSRFGSDVVRIIARPTRVYASLLGESTHPDLLRDALDRDLYFDRLWSFSPERAHLSALVTWEQADLWSGDIPKWTATASGTDLLHRRGKMERFFKTSGLALARAHLERFDGGDLAKQRWIVRAAMTTLASDARRARWGRYSPDADAPILGAEGLISAAERLGDWIVQQAIVGGSEANWLGLAFVGDHWVLAPLGTDLYGGLLGVALFLAQLAEVSQKEKYRDFAERAMRTWLRRDQQAYEKADSIGGYGGLGGLVYGLARLSVLWDRPEYRERIRERVGVLRTLIGKDTLFDVLSGSAGAVGALVAAEEMTGEGELIPVAREAAEHLIASARPMRGGLGWPVAECDNQALAGFSHGAGGIAWSLLRLFERTGEAEYRRRAMEAIAYERSLFVEAEGNYHDLRPAVFADKEAPFTYAWCHGAPGIGLARLRHLSILDDAAREEVRVTVRTTLGSLGRGHSACHGDLGNLELPITAARVLGDAEMGEQARRALAAAVQHGQRSGWLSGVPLSVETPGLMVGLAGMGYQLLRFARPEVVPSVLLLEGQRATLR